MQTFKKFSLIAAVSLGLIMGGTTIDVLAHSTMQAKENKVASKLEKAGASSSTANFEAQVDVTQYETFRQTMQQLPGVTPQQAKTEAKQFEKGNIQETIQGN
jgi:hypothetical protein